MHSPSDVVISVASIYDKNIVKGERNLLPLYTKITNALLSYTAEECRYICPKLDTQEDWNTKTTSEIYNAYVYSFNLSLVSVYSYPITLYFINEGEIHVLIEILKASTETEDNYVDVINTRAYITNVIRYLTRVDIDTPLTTKDFDLAINIMAKEIQYVRALCYNSYLAFKVNISKIMIEHLDTDEISDLLV